jgi:hypothetical protein
MESNVLLPKLGALNPQAPQTTLQVFALAAYCYAERPALLPALNSALAQCGGWMLERRATSATAMEFLFEVQLQTMLELYASLVGIGVELTRSAHTSLTELCTCMQHRASTANPFQVVTFRLEINFLADVTLHSILMTGADLA